MRFYDRFQDFCTSHYLFRCSGSHTAQAHLTMTFEECMGNNIVDSFNKINKIDSPLVYSFAFRGKVNEGNNNAF